MSIPQLSCQPPSKRSALLASFLLCWALGFPLGGNIGTAGKKARPEPGRNMTQTKILAVDGDAMVQKGLRTSCHAGKVTLVKNYILTATSRDFLP
jgi:hypothetical protein